MKFDARVGGHTQRPAIFRIDRIGRCHAVRVSPLNDVEERCPLSSLASRHQMFEVAPAASRNGVRKAGLTRFTKRHAFDFDPAGHVIVRMSRKPKIESGPFLDGDFTLHGRIASEWRIRGSFKRSSRNIVGFRRMQPHPRSPDANHLKGMSKLSLGIVGGRTTHSGAGGLSAGHSSRIRTMNGQFAAVFEQHVGKEALVALDQSPFEFRLDHEVGRRQSRRGVWSGHERDQLYPVVGSVAARLTLRRAEGSLQLR